nr:hypothetical protein [Tanacetum cinerariifolium]GEY91962.1 hypothetical protein [Tanacetum cinerariifolium]
MSRDVLTVGSTMRIPLLYRGEYSQWVERFMNYLEEQMDGEAMINCIKNGDQPLPRVTQVSIAETLSAEQLPLKDKSMWSDQEKKIQEIDRLARSLLIQRLSNDIYSLIDSNKTAKDLWDALARHMIGFEYREQDSEASSSSADDKIYEVSYYLFESESEPEYETLEYYDNTTTYGLFVNDNDDQENFYDFENFPKKLIESQIDHNESAVDHNDSGVVDKKQIADQEVLYDKMSVQLVELDKHVRDLKTTVLEKDFKIFELEECQTSSLKPYVPTMILEKIIIDLEDEVVSLLEKEKENLKTIESLKSNDVETGVQSSEKVVSET